MSAQKEIDEMPLLKTRVRITTLTNRSSRIAAIRIALIQREGKDFLIEEVSDMIMEKGCKSFEKELGL